MNLTMLRQELYKVVDEIIETGIPRTIERKGHVLEILPKKRGSKLSHLKRHDCIIGNPEDLVNLKVEKWNAEKNVNP